MSKFWWKILVIHFVLAVVMVGCIAALWPTFLRMAHDVSVAVR